MRTLPYILGVTLLATVSAAGLVPVAIQALDKNEILSFSNQQVLMSGTRNITLTARDNNDGADEVCDSINGKIGHANDVAKTMMQSSNSEQDSWNNYAKDTAKYSKMVAEIADDLGEFPALISAAGSRGSTGAAIIGSVLASVVFSHL